MHIMYVAPMFHTNQYPIVEGWIQNEHTVSFISQYSGFTENHTILDPIILGYSKGFQLCNSIFLFLFSKKKRILEYPEFFKDKCGFPSIFKVRTLLQSNKPDLMIVRERSMYSIFFYLFAKAYKIPCILYNQTPLYLEKPAPSDVAHVLVNMLTPVTRMTPVLGNTTSFYIDEHANYIPFVMKPILSPDKKLYFKDNTIHILCVGKFEPRKHQMMLLEAFKQLKDAYSISLTLVGQVSSTLHEEYYKNVQDFIKENHLEDCITCYKNCKPNEMKQFYASHELFVLPSTREFASISNLEAMAYSMAILISDTNGTSCYVESDKNGLLFKDEDSNDFYNQLKHLISNRNLIRSMGESSYELILKKYSFENYKLAMESLLSKGIK
ncbi:MAG: glycosyltransferase family 4 protein [Lachnospiraceae bacterium]